MWTIAIDSLTLKNQMSGVKMYSNITLSRHLWRIANMSIHEMRFLRSDCVAKNSSKKDISFGKKHVHNRQKKLQTFQLNVITI